ncbi:transglutaminase-like cysteine peptidase [Pannonibacter indicus]|uniref:Predicted transglutaminase-like cysteine proteinase n=1 Tax=Pannonibacter indicus TaxID=466044 RepID=A0A0K6I3R0_9HYPH|nr:transglutaminase-like cysteine peptidase [Pannonibacter indicus]CUA97789.1 Predicted transglutaminase-like cysteine proteinase [Pannonibacter indicus]
MFKKVLAAAAAALFLSATAYQPAQASWFGGARTLGDPEISRIEPKNTVRAPLAYQIFCLRNSAECRKSKGATSVPYSAALAAKIERVNLSVNRSMKWRQDERDIWKVGGAAGDCEDFALTKRSRLVRMGVPAGALRMAVVKTRKGEGHAVLVVRTTKGDLVLDNTKDEVLTREQTNYRWIGLASADPLKWERL